MTPQLRPAVRTNKVDSAGRWRHSVWCSIHDRHPSECFDVHYPKAGCHEAGTDSPAADKRAGMDSA